MPAAPIYVMIAEFIRVVAITAIATGAMLGGLSLATGTAPSMPLFAFGFGSAILTRYFLSDSFARYARW